MQTTFSRDLFQMKCRMTVKWLEGGMGLSQERCFLSSVHLHSEKVDTVNKMVTKGIGTRKSLTQSTSNRLSMFVITTLRVGQ